jgi:hypothetical protein
MLFAQCPLNKPLTSALHLHMMMVTHARLQILCEDVAPRWRCDWIKIDCRQFAVLLDHIYVLTYTISAQAH